VKRIVEGTNHGNNNLILFAPRTGKESRAWLARRAREIKDKVASAFVQAKDTVEREKEIARREAKEIARVQDLNR